MTGIHTWDPTGAPARVAPQFRLVPFHLLAPAELAHFSDLAADPRWAGVMVPEGAGWRRFHVVSRETAGLLDSLREGATLPANAHPRAIARLVLDGIVELEDGGSFLSGPAAHGMFFSAHPPAEKGSALAELSMSGLCYSGSLGISDPRSLADRLYRFNSRAVSPRWRNRLPDERAVARLLEANRHGRALRRGTAKEGVFESPGGRGVWRVWDIPGAGIPRTGAPTFKLYVSPDVAAVGDALRALLGLIQSANPPFSVKVGRDLPSLLRPDKLVAYFATLADLREAARRLQAELSGMPAQGVPFTASLSEDALMSWAVDPDDESEPPGPRSQRSWRGWITTRLAAGIASAISAGAPVAPWRYALDRVSLEGVDPERWVRRGWFLTEPRFDADY